jgi:hypothetical protein
MWLRLLLCRRLLPSFTCFSQVAFLSKKAFGGGIEVLFLICRGKFCGVIVIGTLMFDFKRVSKACSQNDSYFWNLVMNADPPICLLKSLVNIEQHCIMRRGEV